MTMVFILAAYFLFNRYAPARVFLCKILLILLSQRGRSLYCFKAGTLEGILYGFLFQFRAL